jgi:hypothetical protein
VIISTESAWRCKRELTNHCAATARHSSPTAEEGVVTATRSSNGGSSILIPKYTQMAVSCQKLVIPLGLFTVVVAKPMDNIETSVPMDQIAK